MTFSLVDSRSGEVLNLVELQMDWQNVHWTVISKSHFFFLDIRLTDRYARRLRPLRSRDLYRTTPTGHRRDVIVFWWADKKSGSPIIDILCTIVWKSDWWVAQESVSFILIKLLQIDFISNSHSFLKHSQYPWDACCKRRLGWTVENSVCGTIKLLFYSNTVRRRAKAAIHRSCKVSILVVYSRTGH